MRMSALPEIYAGSWKERIRATATSLRSPDLNPIGRPSARLQHLLRKSAARSAETICVTSDEILRAFAPTECANYFRNSSYAQS
jgi:hypothetical protein